jgi:hypothetical protein
MAAVSAGGSGYGPRWRGEKMRDRNGLPLSICVILVNAAMAEVRENPPPTTDGSGPVPGRAGENRGAKA